MSKSPLGDFGVLFWDLDLLSGFMIKNIKRHLNCVFCENFVAPCAIAIYPSKPLKVAKSSKSVAEVTVTLTNSPTLISG